MAYHLILLFTLLLIVIVHLADANYCEGRYNTNKEAIFRGFDIERARVLFGGGYLGNIFLGTFLNICICSNLEKISVCMKVLQHKLKPYRPVSFTTDLTESDCECRDVELYGRTRDVIHKQRMYTCPKTTIKYKQGDGGERSDEEPPFLLGPAYHRTQMRVRFTDSVPQTGPAEIKGQLTGINWKQLNLEITPDGNCTYKPALFDSDASKPVGIVESKDDGSDDKSGWEGSQSRDVDENQPIKCTGRLRNCKLMRKCSTCFNG